LAAVVVAAAQLVLAFWAAKVFFSFFIKDNYERIYLQQFIF
jgi:hypothetical protein